MKDKKQEGGGRGGCNEIIMRLNVRGWSKVRVDFLAWMRSKDIMILQVKYTLRSLANR